MLHKLLGGMRVASLATLCLLVCSGRAVGGPVRRVETEFARIVDGPGAFYDTVDVVGQQAPLEIGEQDESGRWAKVVSYPKSKGQEQGTVADKQLWVAVRCLAASQEQLDTAELGVVQNEFGLDESFTAYAIRGYDSNVAAFMSAEEVEVESIEFLLSRKFTSKQYEAFRKETLAGRELPKFYRISDVPVPLDQMTAASLGTMVAERLVRDLHRPFIKDAELLAYVNMVAQWLAEQTPRYDMQVRVLVIEDEAPNSFSTPGGFIILTTGLLRFCRNEAELAIVLAHEIVHIWRQHGLLEREAIRKRLKMDIVGLEAELDAELKRLGRTPAWNQPQFKELNALAYEFLSKTLLSRRRIGDEDQADTYGLIFAYKAGYDVSAARSLLQRLMQAQPSSEMDVFLNHATPRDRISQVEWTIKKLGLYRNEDVLFQERYRKNTASCAAR